MTRTATISRDPAVLQAALEGFELQRKRIDEQINQVRALLGKRKNGTNGTAAEAHPTGRKQLSSAARKRIAAAQTKRWAEFRKTHSQTKEKK